MEQEVNTYGVGKNVNFGVLGLEMEFHLPHRGRLGMSWNSVNLWESWGTLEPRFFNRFFLFFLMGDEVILKP